MYGTKYRV